MFIDINRLVHLCLLNNSAIYERTGFDDMINDEEYFTEEILPLFGIFKSFFFFYSNVNLFACFSIVLNAPHSIYTALYIIGGFPFNRFNEDGDVMCSENCVQQSRAVHSQNHQLVHRTQWEKERGQEIGWMESIHWSKTAYDTMHIALAAQAQLHRSF